MTREKIKNTPEVVDYLISESVMPESKEKLHKRLDEICNLAVKALEQEHCEDCISRQEVLDYMEQMPYELTTDGRRMIRRRALEEYISDTLPSVQPEPKTGYISIDDVMSVFDDFMCGEIDENETETFLKMLKDKAESEVPNDESGKV